MASTPACACKGAASPSPAVLTLGDGIVCVQGAPYSNQGITSKWVCFKADRSCEGMSYSVCELTDHLAYDTCSWTCVESETAHAHIMRKHLHAPHMASMVGARR